MSLRGIGHGELPPSAGGWSSGLIQEGSTLCDSKIQTKAREGRFSTTIATPVLQWVGAEGQESQMAVSYNCMSHPVPPQCLGPEPTMLAAPRAILRRIWSPGTLAWNIVTCSLLINFTFCVLYHN